MDIYFYPRKSQQFVFLDLHDASQADMDMYINNLQIVSSFSTGYVADLSTLTISILMVYFGFIPITNDFVLRILFTMQFRLLTQIANIFSGFFNIFGGFLRDFC